MGLMPGKSHVYNSDKKILNFNEDLEMPVPDTSRFCYKYRDTKMFVVGQHRIYEFDLETLKWRVMS